MVSSFSLSQLKIMPPITRPTITSRKSAGENQPIIIATWYKLNATALNMYQLSAGMLFQIGKNKATEEELLKERIRKGDIQAHIEKVLFCDTCVVCQGTGNLREIKERRYQKVSTEDHHIDANTKGDGWQQSFLLWTEQRQVEYAAIHSGGNQWNQHKECNLDRRFDCIARLDHTIHQRHCQTANERNGENKTNTSFFHFPTPHSFDSMFPFYGRAQTNFSAFANTDIVFSVHEDYYS